jgi:response regulator RpfG family c-di-GMP phosphodiesterase
VADAYDLLTSGSRDQPPLSPGQAKEKMLADQEQGFDPTVMKAFAAAVDRMDMELPEMVL